MWSLLRANSVLLFGILLLMTGHGLQGTLLSLRTEIEAFSTLTSGAVLAGYFLGLLVGSVSAPRMIAQVGHVRVFAAMTAIASSTILFHLLVIEPASWFLFRFGTGFCLAGIYVVAESWLNAGASNELRGGLLSIYVLLQNVGFALGPLLLNLFRPDGFEAFVVVSVLLSLAVVPMLLTAVPVPPLAPPRKFGIADLWQISPLGLWALVAVGVVQGAILSMGPIYGTRLGLGVGRVSVLMAAAAVGGLVLQWPIGRLSDHHDRRRVLILASTTGAVLALLLLLPGISSDFPLILGIFFLVSGCLLSLYSVAVAHINDHLQPEDMVAASGAMLLTNGIGAVLGPLLSAALMAGFGASGFPFLLALVSASLSAFALYRSTVRPPVPSEERAPHLPLSQPSSVALGLAQEHASEWGAAEPDEGSEGS